jgi:hypothetical protein
MSEEEEEEEEEERQQQQFVWDRYPNFWASFSHKIKDQALRGPMGQALFSDNLA